MYELPRVYEWECDCEFVRSAGSHAYVREYVRLWKHVCVRVRKCVLKSMGSMSV